MTPRDPIILSAAAKVGGAAKLAKALDLERATIYYWRRVPPHHVLAVERITGVSRHDLRPDLYPREAA